MCFFVEVLVVVFLLKKSRRSGARRLFQRFVIVGDVYEFVVVVEEEWDYSQDLLLLMILLLLLVDYVVEFLLSFMFSKRSRRSEATRLDLRFVVVDGFVNVVEKDWGKKIGFQYLCVFNDFDDIVVVVKVDCDRRLALRFVVVVDDHGKKVFSEICVLSMISMILSLLEMGLFVFFF